MKTETRTTEEMLLHLNNVTKTYYGAGGHGKGARNEGRMRYLIEQLSKKGIVIPTLDERLEKGIFNGVGSC